MQAILDRLGPRKRWILPITGLAAFAGAIALYFGAREAYFALMTAVIKVPVRDIFADWVWIPSAIECWGKGVNVYANNTCYFWPNSFSYNYSPLWLRLKFIPLPLGAAMATAIGINIAFFLSLAWLRPPQTPRELVVLVLALLSSAIGLLVERGNADLIMFILIIAGASASLRVLPWRLAGYGLIVAAGLLKFYPLAALAVAARERAAVLLAVSLAAAAAMAALVLSYGSELAMMAQNLPKPSWFTLQFGSADLPAGLAVLAAKAMARLRHVDPGDLGQFRAAVQLALTLLLALCAAAGAYWSAQRWSFASAVRVLPERDAVFLVAGAAVLCGCFFVGQSLIYRAVFWLLVLPAWLSLSRLHPLPAGRRAFRVACGLVLFVLWVPFVEWIFGVLGLARPPHFAMPNPFDNIPDIPFGLLLWLAHELAWWVLVSTMTATAASYLIGVSPLISRLRLVRPLRSGAA